MISHPWPFPLLSSTTYPLLPNPLLPPHTPTSSPSSPNPPSPSPKPNPSMPNSSNTTSTTTSTSSSPSTPSTHPPLSSTLLSSLLTPTPPLLTFNLLIKSFSSSNPSLSLSLFLHLLSSSLTPDQYTLPSILNSSASLSSLSLAQSLHSFSIKTNLISDPFILSSLLSAYSKCARPDITLVLVNNLSSPDLPTFNSALTGLNNNSQFLSSLRVFARLLASNLAPNRTTLSAALTACARAPEFALGKTIHANVVKTGGDIVNDVSVNSALVFMYARADDADSATYLLKAMPDRNVVSWNALISALARGKKEREAWEVFVEMLEEGFQVSEVTVTSMFTVSRFGEGRMMHAVVVKMGFAREEVVGAAVVDMYGRLGRLVDARNLFDEMPERTEMGAWNSLW